MCGAARRCERNTNAKAPLLRRRHSSARRAKAHVQCLIISHALSARRYNASESQGWRRHRQTRTASARVRERYTAKYTGTTARMRRSALDVTAQSRFLSFAFLRALPEVSTPPPPMRLCIPPSPPPPALPRLPRPAPTKREMSMFARTHHAHTQIHTHTHTQSRRTTKPTPRVRNGRELHPRMTRRRQRRRSDA